MKEVKLFHLFDKKYEQIVTAIEKSTRKNILRQSITVYNGIGRYAILSADNEINSILNKYGCMELTPDHMMIKAIAKEPDVFDFCYGNENLVSALV